jgi:hypothetical protein
MRINTGNCRQHSCYPSSNFPDSVMLILAFSVRFVLYVLYSANRPPLFVAVCGILGVHENFAKEMLFSTGKKKKRGGYCFICGLMEEDENHRFVIF